MRNTDYIDLSIDVQPFEGIMPAFSKKMGEGYTIGKTNGADDYLEVIDCNEVRKYILENVQAPQNDGELVTYEGFIAETVFKEDDDGENN